MIVEPDAAVVIQQQEELDGPAGEIIMCVMAWAAKMERLAINERIASARERVEAEGRSWGRPRSLTDAQVGRVLELQRDGCSLKEIAAATGTARSTVQR